VKKIWTISRIMIWFLSDSSNFSMNINLKCAKKINICSIRCSQTARNFILNSWNFHFLEIGKSIYPSRSISKRSGIYSIFWILKSCKKYRFFSKVGYLIFFVREEKRIPNSKLDQVDHRSFKSENRKRSALHVTECSIM
jgi:hypothetical protein